MTTLTEEQIRSAEASRVDYAFGGSAFAVSISDLMETALAAIAERDRLLVEAGSLRICVNCGRTNNSGKSRDAPHPDCPSPDACTFDMTPQEAVVYWRLVSHSYRVERDRLRKALASIAANTCCAGCGEAALVAASALKGNDE